MRIGTEEGVKLFEQLRNDSLFLCGHGIMDYSLLLGVMDIEFAVDQLVKRPTHSTLSDHTTVNPETSLSTITSTNDSFLSMTSRHWSRESSASDLSSPPDDDDDSMTQAAMPLDLNLAPSVHSLLHPSTSSCNESRYPSSGGAPRPKRAMRKSQRVFGPGYYYVGIIDILQTWTLEKQLERVWKVGINQKDGDGLSAMDPVRYQRRFEAKLREIIAIPNELYARPRRRTDPKHAAIGESVHRLSPVLQAAAAFQTAAAAAQEDRRTRADSTDVSTWTSSLNPGDDRDLEQAGRNPRPILLPFNQRLLTKGPFYSRNDWTG